MNEHVSIVVTSIFEPNACLRELAKGATLNGWDFIIIGDSKSPRNFSLEGAQFFDIETQKEFDFKLARLCPVGHYTRKNLGYLLSIKNGSSIIIETDDDNFPTSDFWKPREKNLSPLEVDGKNWINVYSLYSDKPVWPRGLPLENVMQSDAVKFINSNSKCFCPIQQGLADANPDVDAVFRMTQPLPLNFNKRGQPVKLNKGLWSPFNSQNTTWFKEAFPLLYLPSYCTFRMTDIWRSFVAQRIAWECGWSLIFHDATVYQERNEHNLLRDFEQEIPGYLLNNKIKKLLDAAPLLSGVENISNNLRMCYQILIQENIITSKDELDLLDAWLFDIEKLG
jgi:hypothetical protein